MMMYIQPPGVNQAVDRVIMDGRCTIAKIGTVICKAMKCRVARPRHQHTLAVTRAMSMVLKALRHACLDQVALLQYLRSDNGQWEQQAEEAKCDEVRRHLQVYRDSMSLTNHAICNIELCCFTRHTANKYAARPLRCLSTFLRPKQQTRMSSFCMTPILASSTCDVQTYVMMAPGNGSVRLANHAQHVSHDQTCLKPRTPINSHPGLDWDGICASADTALCCTPHASPA
jgi:hypothetical protein